MSKPVKSKLDQFASTLADMEAEKKTLAEMQAWLKAEGCAVSLTRISDFLSALRSSRQQAQMLAQIASGARQCAEVEKSFGRNPAPELETLIKLQRVILLKLSTQANADPSLLELIGNSFKAVLTAEKLKLQRAQVQLDERRVSLLEKKAAQADATEKVLTDAELTPEERAARIKEIYGR